MNFGGAQTHHVKQACVAHEKSAVWLSAILDTCSDATPAQEYSITGLTCADLTKCQARASDAGKRSPARPSIWGEAPSSGGVALSESNDATTSSRFDASPCPSEVVRSTRRVGEGDALFVSAPLIRNRGVDLQRAAGKHGPGDAAAVFGDDA